jgi:small nuclear ribonucleoprotein (snRNP)-like protein
VQKIEMRAKLIMLDDGMNAMLAGPVERYSAETGELLGTDKEDILVKGSNVIHVALLEGSSVIQLPHEERA